MMSRILLLALAGACGTLARYGLGGLVQRLSGQGFPLGTLAVNLLGCFLFGAVWAVAGERGVGSPEARVIVLAGFMGAFTTFSTFAFETGQLIRDSQWLLAAGNVAGQTFAGVLCMFLGLAAGRCF